MALPQRKNEPQINQPEPGQTRRVQKHFNSDWEYLNKNKEASNDSSYSSPSHPTVDQSFTDTDFGRTGMIMQPTGLNAANESKISPEASKEASGGRESEGKINEYGTKNMPIKPSFFQSKAKMAERAKRNAARFKTSSINTAAMSWQVPLWLTFQLPLAIFNVITLAVVGARDAISANTDNPLTWIAGKLISAQDALLSLVGLNFIEISGGLFMITEMAIIGFGVMSILFLFLQYKMAFINPLSGQHSSLKLGTLLLVIVGYTIPIANMFPFIFLWMAVVWLYPR